MGLFMGVARMKFRAEAAQGELKVKCNTQLFISTVLSG